jgi:hypothetical protein
MPDKLFFVEGDRKPDVYFALKTAEGAAIDVSSGTATVKFRFIQQDVQGGTPKQGIITLSKPNGGTDGVVLLTWATTSLDTPGEFQAEIEIDWNGLKQTVPDLVHYNVRPKLDVT